MITIVLECIDRLNVYNTAAHFSEFAGEEAAESWKEIVNLLYELLGEERNLKLWKFTQSNTSDRQMISITLCFSTSQLLLSEGIVRIVRCSVTIWTGWSANWIVWRLPPVSYWKDSLMFVSGRNLKIFNQVNCRACIQ